MAQPVPLKTFSDIPSSARGNFWKKLSIKTRDSKRVTLQAVPRTLTTIFLNVAPLPPSLLHKYQQGWAGGTREKLGQQIGYTLSGPQGEEEQRGEFSIRVPETPWLSQGGSPPRGQHPHNIILLLWNERVAQTLPPPLDPKSW